MMPILNLYDTAKRRALSSRETARSIAPIISELLSDENGDGSLTIDLGKVVVVNPSFFDELLHVINDSVPTDRSGAPVIDLTNTSENQFARFRAMCRAHKMITEEVAPDHWRISKA